MWSWNICVPSSLKVLSIRGCFTEPFLFQKLDYKISNTSCLQELVVKCDFLTSFTLDLFPNLRSLKLFGCKNLEMIHISEGNNHDLTSLTFFSISRCPELKTCHFEDLENLKSLPKGMNILFPSLTQLRLMNCDVVTWASQWSYCTATHKVSI